MNQETFWSDSTLTLKEVDHADILSIFTAVKRVTNAKNINLSAFQYFFVMLRVWSAHFLVAQAPKMEVGPCSPIRLSLKIADSLSPGQASPVHPPKCIYIIIYMVTWYMYIWISILFPNFAPCIFQNLYNRTVFAFWLDIRKHRMKSSLWDIDVKH